MSETRALASYIVDNQLEDIPTDVRHEARRAILNYMGCAVGGAPHPAMDITLRALGPYAGKPTSSVLGRAERIDPLHASLLNGISSHVQEYSDETVNDRQVKRVRELATAVGDPSITEDQAHIAVDLVGGRRLEVFIEKSLGNVNRPMTDRQLDTKFRDQALLAIPAPQAEALLNLCWRIDEVDDVNEVVTAPCRRGT